jgi:glycosyltransferase involved in cell wall biosynthesis
MTKTILIVTDNLPDQINGVVTTYKNIETMALLDGYTVDYIHPGRYRFIDCPKYNEVKLTFTKKVGKTIKEIAPNYIHIATEGPLGLSARKYLTKRGIRYNTAYHTKFPEGLKALFNMPEKFTWAFVRWFHKHSKCVLTTTDTMVKELKTHKFKGNVIPWTRGVDREIFYPELNREKNKRPVLVCISRVSKEKNLEDFFNLDYSNARKIMVGDGPMLNEYKTNYPDVEFVGAKRPGQSQQPGHRQRFVAGGLLKHRAEHATRAQAFGRIQRQGGAASRAPHEAPEDRR